RNEVFYDKLKYVYVELPKFRNTADELSTRREKWLYVFRHLARLNERPEPLKERIFERLFEVAKISNFSPEEQDEYEESLKVYRDIKNVVDTSREEGMEEGIEKGIELVAKKLLALGVSFEVVITSTGLTEDQLKKLAEE
ncbi:MAG: Rpn family recombination-promoting nuclease/putative transposase, partial [Saprospiraceae bacterium]